MPSVDYLRELSLLKRGYSPAEAKSIVDEEVIRRFESQSTAVKDSYSKYYSTLLSNRGTQNTPTVGVQQFIAAPAVDSSLDVVGSYYAKGAKSSIAQTALAKDKIQQAPKPPTTSPVGKTGQDIFGLTPKAPTPLDISNIPDPALAPINLEQYRKPVSLSDVEDVYTALKNPPKVAVQSFSEPKPILNWNNLPKSEKALQELRFRERSNNDQVLNKYFSDLLNPETDLKTKSDLAIKLTTALKSKISGIEQATQVRAGGYIEQQDVVDKNQKAKLEQLNLGIQQIDQIYKKQIAQSLVEKAYNNPEFINYAKKNREQIGPKNPYNANFLGEFPSFVGMDEQGIFKLLNLTNTHNASPDPNKPAERNEYGMAFYEAVENAGPNNTPNMITRGGQMATDMAALSSEISNALNERHIQERLAVNKTQEDLISQFESLPDNEKTQKKVDEVTYQIKFLEQQFEDKDNAVSATLKNELDLNKKDRENDWRINAYKTIQETASRKQLEADMNSFKPFFERQFGNIAMGLTNSLVNSYANYFIARNARSYAEDLKNEKTSSRRLSFDAPVEGSIGITQMKINKALVDYLETDSYPTVDILTSSQVGRTVHSSEFIVLDPNALVGVRFGSGLATEAFPTIVKMVPGIALAAVTKSAAGLTTRLGVSAISRTKLAAESIEKGTRLGRIIESTKLGGSNSQVWSRVVNAEANLYKGSTAAWWKRNGIKLLESRVPTYLGVSTSVKPLLYHETLKELQRNRVENAESKAKAISDWLAAIEGLTEAILPDISYFMPKEALAGGGFLSDLFRKFGGKKVANYREIHDLYRKFNLSPASATWMAKTTYLLKKGGLKALKSGELAGKMGFNLQEGIEEVAAELGGYFVNYAYEEEKGQPAEDVTFENLLNAFTGGALLTGPISILKTRSYLKEASTQTYYRMAVNPEFYKAKISELLKKGKIKQEQAIDALTKIDSYSKILRDETSINLVRQSDFFDDTDAQYSYFSARLQSEEWDKYINSDKFRNLSDEQKEEILKDGNEIASKIDTYKRKASAFSDLTEEDKKQRLIEIAKKNITKYYPTYSINRLEKAKQKHEEEKAKAQIRYKSNFDRIKDPLDFVIGEADKVIQERKAAVEQARQNGTLNPLLEDFYSEEQKNAGVDALGIEEIEELLMQASLNPDTESMLDDAFSAIGMAQQAKQILDQVEAIVLEEISEKRQERGKPKKLLTAEELDNPEDIDYLAERKQEAENQVNEYTEQAYAFLNAIVKKFLPTLQNQNISQQELFDRLFSDQFTLSYQFLRDQVEFSQAELVDHQAFKDALAATRDLREAYVSDVLAKEEEIKKKEEEDRLRQEQAAQAPQTEEVIPEIPVDEPIIDEEEILPVELKAERVAPLGTIPPNIITAANRYVGSNRAGVRSRNRTTLVEYVISAPTREEAVARAMFVASLRDEDTAEVETLINTLFNNPTEFFANTSNIEALRLTDFGIGLASRESKIVSKFPPEHIEFPPVEVIEPSIQEAPVPEEVVQGDLFEPQFNGEFQEVPGQTYGIAYSNKDLEDSESPDHNHTLKQRKILNTVSRNRSDYKIKIVDLFTFLRETGRANFVNGNKDSISSLYNEYLKLQALPDGETKDKLIDDLKKKASSLFEEAFSPFFRPKAIKVFTDQFFNPKYHGLTDGPKSSYQGANIVLMFAVDNEGNYSKFDDEGNATDSGNNYLGFTIRRDTNTRWFSSAAIGKKIREITLAKGSFSAVLNIEKFWNYTGSPDKSVGVSVNPTRVIEALDIIGVKPSTVEEAKVPVIETEEESEDARYLYELTMEQDADQAAFDSESFGSAVENAIGRYGQFRTTRESFNREGDRNQLEGKENAFTNYFGGTETLDQIAKTISDETEVEVTPQDLVDFILNYPAGVGSKESKSTNTFYGRHNPELNPKYASLREKQKLSSFEQQKVKEFEKITKTKIARIEKSDDPQEIFSEINTIQESLKANSNYRLTSEQEELIKKKLKDLGRKGYSFKTRKGKVVDTDVEKVRVQNSTQLFKNQITENEKEIIAKELERREKNKAIFLKNGETEEEATTQAGLSEDDSIDIVSRDIEVSVLLNGEQVKGGSVETKLISIRDAKSVLGAQEIPAVEEPSIPEELPVEDEGLTDLQRLSMGLSPAPTPTVEPTPQAPSVTPVTPATPVGPTVAPPTVPMPVQPTGSTPVEFSRNAVKNLIQFSERVPEPIKLPNGMRAYRIGDKYFMSQSQFNKKDNSKEIEAKLLEEIGEKREPAVKNLVKSDLTKEELDYFNEQKELRELYSEFDESGNLLKSAVATGDIYDEIGRHVLGGNIISDRDAFLREVVNNVMTKQNLAVPPKIDIQLANELIDKLEDIRTEWSEEYEIFTDRMVFYSEFNEPQTINGETFYGVAGVPDILLVDKKSGKLSLVDMKNVKFTGTSNTETQLLTTKFKEKEDTHWKLQQNTYVRLAKGLLPKIESIGILVATSSYDMTPQGEVVVTKLKPTNMESVTQAPGAFYVGKLGLDIFGKFKQNFSSLKDRNELNFADNNNPNESTTNDCS